MTEQREQRKGDSAVGDLMEALERSLYLGQKATKVGAKVIETTRYVAICNTCDWSGIDSGDIGQAEDQLVNHMIARHAG